MRVHFEEGGNNSTQTVTTDPSRSIFPAPTQSSNAGLATAAAVPAQPMGSDQRMREDFGIREGDDDEEEAGQTQGGLAQPLLPVPQGARLPTLLCLLYTSPSPRDA